MKLEKFKTYNPYEIWWTACYHSPLYSAIPLGVLQKICIERCMPTHTTHIIYSTAHTRQHHLFNFTHIRTPVFVDKPQWSDRTASQMDGEAGW